MKTDILCFEVTVKKTGKLHLYNSVTHWKTHGRNPYDSVQAFIISMEIPRGEGGMYCVMIYTRYVAY
jgi:hypothetical protein